MTTRSAFPISLDGAAIGVSTLCIIHCLALPLLVVALPALAAVAEVEWVHKALVLVAAPVSLFAMTRLHGVEGRLLISALIVVGLALLIAGAFVEALHDHEVLLTVAGALILSVAHILRWRAHRTA